MALRRFRAGAAGVALMAAAVAGAGGQTSVGGGPAQPVDLATAPVLPSAPVPAIHFDRPTPKIGHGAVRQRRASPTKRPPPDTASDRR